MCSFASSLTLSSPPVFGNPFFLMTEWRESHRLLQLLSSWKVVSHQLKSNLKQKIRLDSMLCYCWWKSLCSNLLLVVCASELKPKIICLLSRIERVTSIFFFFLLSALKFVQKSAILSLETNCKCLSPRLKSTLSFIFFPFVHWEILSKYVLDCRLEGLTKSWSIPISEATWYLKL